jgi:hypothetical protein
MAYRKVTKQWLHKQRSLLGNAPTLEGVIYLVFAATVAMKRHGKHASTVIEGLYFLRGSCRGVILKKVGAAVQVGVQLRDIRRTVTTWAQEPEESPLLEAVAMERLLKTQQAEKGLSGFCGNMWTVEVSGAVIKRSSEWYIQVSNKSIHQSIVTPLNRDNIIRDF